MKLNDDTHYIWRAVDHECETFERKTVTFRFDEKSASCSASGE
ncbi:MAG: hypothetical protein ABJ162_07690 [Erythrobacter sp.]